jgi:hypothetical protein
MWRAENPGSIPGEIFHLHSVKLYNSVIVFYNKSVNSILSRVHIYFMSIWRATLMLLFLTFELETAGRKGRWWKGVAPPSHPLMYHDDINFSVAWSGFTTSALGGRGTS